MKRFPDILHLSTFAASNECRVFRVDVPFRFDGDLKGTVPEGFLTDGASIPRAFWAIFSSTGMALYPGVVHDYQYSPLSKCTDRAAADLELYNGCREVGIGIFRSTLIYRAVRLFGGKFWKTKKTHECYNPESA